MAVITVNFHNPYFFCMHLIWCTLIQSPLRGAPIYRRCIISKMKMTSSHLCFPRTITSSSCSQPQQAGAPEHGSTRNLSQTCRLILVFSNPRRCVCVSHFVFWVVAVIIVIPYSHVLAQPSCHHRGPSDLSWQVPSPRQWSPRCLLMVQLASRASHDSQLCSCCFRVVVTPSTPLGPGAACVRFCAWVTHGPYFVVSAFRATAATSAVLLSHGTRGLPHGTCPGEEPFQKGRS